MSDIAQNVDVEKIDISIKLLKQYVKDANIEPVYSVLEDLKKEPNNEFLLVKLKETLDSLGILQGAILAYAPYICILVSHDLFEDFD